MTTFELFYRGIRKLLIEDHDLQKLKTAQPTTTCSKLTIEKLEQGVKCVQH